MSNKTSTFSRYIEVLQNTLSGLEFLARKVKFQTRIPACKLYYPLKQTINVVEVETSFKTEQFPSFSTRMLMSGMKLIYCSLSLWFGIAYIKREIANQIVLIGHYAVGILVWCDMIKTPILRKLLELLTTVTGSSDHSCARDLCQPSPKAAVGSREASVVQTVDMVDSLGTLGTS